MSGGLIAPLHDPVHGPLDLRGDLSENGIRELEVRRVEALVEAEQARPARQRNPVAAYRAACRLLRPGMHGEKHRSRGAGADGKATPEPPESRQPTKGENL